MRQRNAEHLNLLLQVLSHVREGGATTYMTLQTPFLKKAALPTATPVRLDERTAYRQKPSVSADLDDPGHPAL